MKKTLIRGTVLCALVGLSALIYSHIPLRLAVSEYPDVRVPPAKPPATMKLYGMNAGIMLSQAGLAYRGGNLLEPREFGMGAILIQHPQGMLLFDTGFGADVDAQLQTTPWLMRATSKIVKEPTVRDQLVKAGIRPQDLKAVVLTHVHWDHVSGLPDLAGVPVWVNAQEKAFVESGHDMSALVRQMGELNYQTYEFSSGPYLGFNNSYDVFGDGSVVLVPAFGHTPGSIIAFVALPNGLRYALIGDLVWQNEGIERPAERPWISRVLADWDDARVRDHIVHLHQLKAAMPELVVVPAHDRRVWDALPKLNTTP